MKIDISVIKSVYDMLRQMPVMRQVGYPSSDEVEFELKEGKRGLQATSVRKL